MGGNPNSALVPAEVPQPQQMPWHLGKHGHLFCWQEGGCDEDSSVVNVFELMTARAGGKWLDESGQGEEEDALTRQWQCCHRGEGWMTAP